MRNILIVGAGQSGLQLALGLQARGYGVTVVSNRSADDIRGGKVMSSQCMFHDSLQLERDRGLAFWEQDCPPVEGISFAVPHPEQAGVKALSWSHRLDHVAQSVDQRVKVPGWMEAFSQRGGRLRFKDAEIEDLEQWTREHDLVIVAAGKGAIAKMFERDADRSPYDRPQRALALTYVHGMRPREEHSAVSFNLIPGVGEYFVFPALTHSGPCEIMVFEGIPGGPMDCWADVRSPVDHLARSLEILQRFLPWEAARCAQVELTDANGLLSGAFPPTVRKPVGRLPSGRLVMGMADAVMLNDPITGQGSNNAAKFAHAVETAIVAQGQAAFDERFMHDTFEGFWNSYGTHVSGWTNAMLAPPPEHVMRLLGSAAASPAVARRIVNGFNDPTDYANFFMRPDLADAYLAQVAPAEEAAA
jgi:2-polyprenyl-6-methoxyphenol hydroxylase-like FAD-dependent oxidoreductase